MSKRQTFVDITLGNSNSRRAAQDRHAFRQAWVEAKRWGATDVSADEYARDALMEYEREPK